MRYLRKYSLFIFPLLGLFLGYSLAYLEYHGLLVAWKPIENPGEPIRQILGVQGHQRLLVVTQSEQVFALEFTEQQPHSLLLPADWQAALDPAPDPHREIVYYGADFTPRPSPVRVSQIYKHTYIYRFEGRGELHFVLSEDGNLWVWDHKISGLSGLIFYYYPLIGFLAGLALALLILVYCWLRSRSIQ